MTAHIVPGNIDTRLLDRLVRMLREGATLAIPTDTSWSLVCAALSKPGAKALRRISGSRDERFFTLICGGLSMAGEFCSLDNTRFRLIKRLTPGPYVFLLDALHGTTKKLDLRRSEIGMRIPDHPVPAALCEALGEPLYAITAKRSLAGPGDGDEILDGEEELFDIPEEDLFDEACELEDIGGLDLILDSGDARPRLLSTILDLRPAEPECLREGAGPWPV